MLLDPLFWEKKRVLITGHTGFIGSWMSCWLSILKVEILGVSLKPKTEPNLFSILKLSEQLDSHFQDICDEKGVSKFVQDFNPEIIIHLAAQPLVKYSYLHPIETYQTNIMGVVYLLEAFKNSQAQVFLNVTTDKCYQNKEWLWGYRENESLGGDDPYSSSKACSEIITYAYQKSFFKDQKKGIATARAGNIIGGGDWSQDRLIPDFIRACTLKNKLQIRYPNSTRPWQYVLDAIYGYLLLVQNLWHNPAKFNGAWNFGPSSQDCKPVKYLIEKLTQDWPAKIDWDLDRTEKVHEATYLKLDTSKAQSLLDWHPRCDIDQTLKSTSDWYLAYLEGQDMLSYSQNEINKFMSLQTSGVDL